jgi:HEPN domain-containing protein
MKRADLQILSEMRLKDAKALLDTGRYAASYYLGGYAVECAIKACIAKQFLRHRVPDRKVVNGFYSHGLDELLRLAGLQTALDSHRRINSEFDAKWQIVKEWTPDSRYEATMTPRKAKNLYDALMDSKHGIVPWLRHHW